MNRRLLIMTNDGGTADFLAGVATDMDNYLHFFQSDEGGAWEDEEIYVPQTSKLTVRTFASYVQRQTCHIDYWLIVFCGHGGLDNKGRTFFVLSEKENLYEQDLFALMGNSRCLLIADSCRTIPIYEQGGRIARQQMFSSTVRQSGYRERCRALYNSQIMRIPEGIHSKAYAASLFQASEDLGKAKGGCYSYNLLLAAKNNIRAIKIARISHPENNADKILSMGWIHMQAKEQVERGTWGKQSPVYSTSRTAQPPFCVVPKSV